MKTWQIRVEGIVQGVGFRPMVYKYAREKSIYGEVSNGIDGVTINFNETEKGARDFYEAILRNKPPVSQITNSSLTPYKARLFTDFEIIESKDGSIKSVLFAPDYALCSECREELTEKTNRRYAYPFTTCTQCGPRYSIITGLPYDRPLTTMHTFNMCQPCLEEYNSPLSRRHFSQTNSCPDCGITLSLISAHGHTISSQEEEIKHLVCQSWSNGSIVAIKGIGGYLLTCDATNSNVIKRLRERKNRTSKPLAVMYPSVEHLNNFHVSEAESSELTNTCSPIVLLRYKQAGLKEIAPGLNSEGVMLPYTPLYQWLLNDFQKPVIATSGNVSGSSIIYTDTRHDDLFKVCDLILSNNREIVLPQDDSVIRYSPSKKQRIVLRRSRGIAPTYFNAGNYPLQQNVLACGADMKSALALTHQGNVYISQYLGDLETLDSQNNFSLVFDHLTQILGFQAGELLADKHPGYASTILAKDIALSKELPLTRVQHHEAHFAAVLGENELVETREKILGVIWDGTGYGNDGNIWGGEFFTYVSNTFTKVSHQAYFPVVAGERMAKEPRVAAFCLMPNAEIVRQKFDDIELKILDNLLQRNDLKTSSIGRLFDAVASLLNLKEKQSFEGEAAMHLESCALTYLDQADNVPTKGYDLEFCANNFNPMGILKQIIFDIDRETPGGEIAYKFHLSLISVIEQVAEQHGTKQLAFSGGVFQNGLLVDLIIEKLSKDFKLYFHKQLSPNDENIAYGQLVHFSIKQRCK